MVSKVLSKGMHASAIIQCHYLLAYNCSVMLHLRLRLDVSSGIYNYVQCHDEEAKWKKEKKRDMFTTYATLYLCMWCLCV